MLLANLFGFLVLPLLAWVTTRSGWDPALALIALSSAMLGAVLPLVSHFGIAPDRLAGTRLSYLYAANIVGSVLGSFLTGFVLLEVMPIRTISALLMIVGGVTVVVLLALGRGSGSGTGRGLRSRSWPHGVRCSCHTLAVRAILRKTPTGSAVSLLALDSQTWWKTAVGSLR